MKKIELVLSFLVLYITSCYADDTQGLDMSLDGLTIENFPIIDGSDSTEPLRQILMCKLLGFSYEWVASPFVQDPDEAPKDVMPDYTCTADEKSRLMTECLLSSNTHQSFVNLIDGKAELILTARSISRDEKVYAEEQGVTLIEKPIAKDALTFMVNQNNPVNSLTIKQIQDIYTGNIVNWNEVGGEDALITPYVRNRNSGSQEKFETMVMEGLTIKDFPEMQIGTTMMTPYYQIESEKTGIAFTPFYYYSVIVGSGSTKAIGVDGVAMTKKNITNGTYPYVTDVYAAVRSDIDKSSMAYRVFDFLKTTGGQAIVEESGYVPLASYTSGIRDARTTEAQISYDNGVLNVLSSVSPTDVLIAGMDGRIVLQKNMKTNRMPLHNMMSGTYIVKITFADGTSRTLKVRR